MPHETEENWRNQVIESPGGERVQQAKPNKWKGMKKNRREREGKHTGKKGIRLKATAQESIISDTRRSCQGAFLRGMSPTVERVG